MWVIVVPWRSSHTRKDMPEKAPRPKASETSIKIIAVFAPMRLSLRYAYPKSVNLLETLFRAQDFGIRAAVSPKGTVGRFFTEL